MRFALLASIICILILPALSFAQIPPPVLVNDTICPGGSVTLTASGSSGSFIWWDAQTGGTSLSTSSTYSTPVLNTSTTYWVEAIDSTSANGSILITECSLENPGNSDDYIEISNLYSTTVNTTGWIVAISNSYSNINAVNSTYWHLPASMGPCTVDYREDASGSHNWGTNMFWNPGDPSWAIILDNNGNIVDFCVWGWTNAQVQSMNTTINGHNITIGSEWIGNGCGLPCGSSSVTTSLQRQGNSDNNNSGDFQCLSSSHNILNPGLSCGWTMGSSGRFPVTVYVDNVSPDAGQDETICAGESVTLNVSGGQNYQWSTTPVQSGSSITVSPTSATTYTVTATSTHGCTGSDDVIVNVNPLPNASAGNDTSACGGVPVTITASGGASYIWNTSETTSSITVQPPTATTYTVTVTDANNCSNTDDIVVSSHPDPVAEAGNDTILCQGDQISLSASGGTSYTWNTAETTASILVSPTLTTTYTVTVTNGFSCTDTDDVAVTVLPVPQVNFTLNPDNGCAPVQVMFTEHTQPTANIFQWDFGDPGSAGNTSTLPNPDHWYHNPGAYDVSLSIVTTEGCTASFSLKPAVTVHANPTAAFSAQPTIAMMPDPSVSFVDQSTGATSWLWNFGDPSSGPSNQSINQNPSHTYTAQGIYHVLLSILNTYGCSDTTTSTITVEGEFAIYTPNAFTPNEDGKNDYFSVSGIGIQSEDYVFRIFDRWGKEVFKTQNMHDRWDGINQNTGETLPQGVYNWVLYARDATNVLHKYMGRVTLIR